MGWEGHLLGGVAGRRSLLVLLTVLELVDNFPAVTGRVEVVRVLVSLLLRAALARVITAHVLVLVVVVLLVLVRHDGAAADGEADDGNEKKLPLLISLEENGVLLLCPDGWCTAAADAVAGLFTLFLCN